MIGKTISHYRVLEKLGEGGMGVVYKAEDTDLQRTVALKFLQPQALGSEEEGARFLHEARAAAALDHPNICTVYEIGRTKEYTFIAMAYVEGQSLKDKIRSGPLKLDDAIDITVQIAEGMEAAHKKGIVHRDIKPANLMVTDEGQVKIMDFGLAKSRGQTALTQADTTLGTFAYMSPEQARSQSVDHRTDIWSLGVVLYEMVTGRRPFQGDYEQAVVYSILNEEPEPMTGLRTGVPIALERIVHKVLAKNPNERYQHAGELAVDLRSARRDFAPGTATSGFTRDTRRWGKRAYLYVGLPILTLLLLLLVGRAYFFPARGETIDSIAVLPLENLSGDPEQEYFVDGMTEALITELSKIRALRVISRTSVMQYKRARKPLPEIARELNVAAVVEGSAVVAGDRVRITAQLIEAKADRHLWAESHERDLRDILGLQKEIARAIAREIRIAVTAEEQSRLAGARPVDPEAHEAYLRGRYHWNKRTEAGFRKAIDFFQQAIEEDPAYAPAYTGLADSYILLVSFGIVSAKEALPEASAAASRALEIDDTLAEAHVSAAAVREGTDWKWAAAEGEYRRAIELNPGRAHAHHWYAYNLGVRGYLDEALEEIERARDLDPLSLIINADVGFMIFWQRRFEEAVEIYRNTLEMEPDFEVGRLYLGLAYLEMGRYEEAIVELRRAVELSGRSPWYTASLGRAYAEAGMETEARAVLNELVGRSERTFVPPSLCAMIHAALGETDRAFEWLDRAYEAEDLFLSYMRVDPAYDPLRSDPRFVALMQKVGLTS